MARYSRSSRRRTTSRSSYRRGGARSRVGVRRSSPRRRTTRRASSSGRTVRIVVQMAQPAGVAPVGQARQIVRRARF